MTDKGHFEIFVRNACDEYVTTVVLRPMNGMHENDPGIRSLASTLRRKWIVADYTRDADVMGADVGGAEVLTAVSVKNHDKLKSFRGYLMGRKKAGVVELEQGQSLYLLPRAGEARVTGETMLVLLRQAGHPGNGGSPGLKAPEPRVTPASIGGDEEAGDSGDSSAEGGQIGGFLGSLMGTLSQTHKTVAGTAAVDRVNRAQDQAIRRRVEGFTAEVRSKLETFASDPSAISHAFSCVEKGLRSIQHGLVEDVDGITSRTEGDLDDRHVVVYKLGHEPPEDDLRIDLQASMGVISKRKAAEKSRGGGRESRDHPIVAELVEIGTVVKDRRTVEDIEAEMRKPKRRKPSDDSH